MSVLIDLAEAIRQLPTSAIWHLHSLKNGHTVLINPYRSTRLCAKEGRCVFIMSDNIEVLGTFRDVFGTRQIFQIDKKEVAEVSGILKDLNEQAEKHGLTIDPDSRL